MNLSEQPFEALVLKCLSFTVVNSFFTWIAVITAAVGLWRIRAVGNNSATSCHHQYESRDLSSPELATSANWVVEEEEEGEAESRIDSCCAVSTDGDGDGDGMMKGKFTAYFVTDFWEGECGNYDGEMTVAEVWCDGGDDGVWEFEEWVGKRRGDLRWYRYQDLTVINGNVVRLWDGVSGWSGSPLC